MVYRVWAECISDVYVDIEADCKEDALDVARDLDGGDFVDSGEGDWVMGDAYEVDGVQPMFYANDFLDEEY